VSLPSVSVVVPTRDRPEQLTRCLSALAGVAYPPERLELIVVNDGGRARLEPICEAARLPVRLLHQEPTGPGAARNRGAAAAEGELLALTDDDCRPDAGWLRALAAALASAPDAGAGGQTLNALVSNPFADASQHIQALVYAHYNRDPEGARFLASNNLAVPRRAFEELGGFDEGFPLASEDRDFCDRWLASGRTLRYAPGAVVHHARELDLAGFVRQHLAYGRGAARYHRARALRGSGRMRDEMSFHRDASLWRRTLGLRPRRRAARMVPLLAIWQAANAAGYLLERRGSARS
jgi:GT2 family glycosyltransferase